MTCPHCQTPLVSDARFCPACGGATAPTTPTESESAWHGAGGAPDLTGKEIAGRYRIHKKLGEGGMGAVYRGEQISLKRAVAVKLLRPELGTNPMILRRFNAEAEAVAKLSHPNTVNIFDFGQDSDGSLFIAMEFIEGRSLREAIQKEGPFSPARALAIALQVAASLTDAHAHSIVHRDLKPDNVMLQDRGRQKDVVRVLDFGIAKLRDDNRATQVAMTQAGDMLGTPQYMAPEQIKGEVIDGRTDIYALGCMIYEMVTARLPYEAPTVMAMLSKHLIEDVVPPTQRRPELVLPASIDQLVLGAMAKEPDGRPSTMDQFSDMISGVLSTLPADPNRSAALSLQQGVVGGMTPSAFAPASPPPPGFANAATSSPQGFTGQPPYGQPGFAAPTPQHAPYGAPPADPGAYLPPGFPQPSYPPTVVVAGDRSKSRAPLYAILGVLALGGAGVGVWAATRTDDAATGSAAKPDPWESTEAADPPDPDDDPPDPVELGTKPDPWGEGGTSANSNATAKTVATANTDAMPLPAGARIVPPAGFKKVQDDANTIGYVNASRGLAVGMASLYAGTNDPDELAKLYVAETGVTFVEKAQGFSAGKNRDVLIFSSEVQGVQVLQTAVLYIAPNYRFAVLYQAPIAMWQDEKFQKEVDAFFITNIKLPATLRQ